MTATVSTAKSRLSQSANTASNERLINSPPAVTMNENKIRSPLSSNQQRSPLAQIVLSPNNNNESHQKRQNSKAAEKEQTPTRRNLTKQELTKPSLREIMERLNSPPAHNATVLSLTKSCNTTDNDSNIDNSKSSSIEEIANELLVAGKNETNEEETKQVLIDLLQAAKENAEYKLILERMKSDEAEYSLRSSKKMSEVTEVYEMLREDKINAMEKIKHLEEEKKQLMIEMKTNKEHEKQPQQQHAKTPLTAPVKHHRFITNNNASSPGGGGLISSPRWEAVKKSAEETAERLRALSSEKGTTDSPFTGTKAKPSRLIKDDDDDVFVDALNTVAHVHQQQQNNTTTEGVEKTQKSIVDALQDSRNEVEVKSLLNSLDQYISELRERTIFSVPNTNSSTTSTSRSQPPTPAKKEDYISENLEKREKARKSLLQRAAEKDNSKDKEEVLKIADKASSLSKSLFSILFLKEKDNPSRSTTNTNKAADHVKSDLFKTFEEESSDKNNMITITQEKAALKKEQEERKKEKAKAAEALNEVWMLLDEKTEEAKRATEQFEIERNRCETLETQLNDYITLQHRNVASISVQTDENIDESLALLEEQNHAKEVQLLQLQSEFADLVSAKNGQISELSHSCSQLSNALESAEREIDASKELAQKNGEMETNMMESLQEIIIERTHELDFARSERESWEQKFEESQSDMLFKNARLETLQNALDESESERATLVKYVQHVETGKEIMSEELEKLNLIISAKYDEVKEMRIQYSEDKSEMLMMINQLGNEMKVHEREAFVWWTRAELENTRVGDLEDEIERLNDELQRVNEKEDEFTELILDCAKLKEEKLTLEEVLEKVDTTNKTLNIRLKKSFERIQELDKEVEEANSDCDFLRKEVNDANARMKELEASNSKETNGDNNNSIETTNDYENDESYDYAKIPAKYEELKLENIELMEKLKHSKAVEEKLTQRLENVVHETDGLKNDAKSAFMKSSEMRKMTENAVEKAAQLTSELEQATNEIQKLENLLKVSRQQVQTLEKEIRFEQQKTTTTADTLEPFMNATTTTKTTQTHDGDRNEVKEYFEAQNEELIALLTSKTNELTELKLEFENLRHKSTSMEEAKTIRAENYELAVRHKATLEKLKALVEERDALEKSCEQYEATVAKTQIVVQELKMEVEALKSPMKAQQPTYAKQLSQAPIVAAENKKSQSTQTNESEVVDCRENIIYAKPVKRRDAEDDLFYDVADDFDVLENQYNDKQYYKNNNIHRRRRNVSSSSGGNSQQLSSTTMPTFYPLTTKGQLPPLRRSAIECYHMDAQRLRLRKQCELEERELQKMRQEKKIISAQLKQSRSEEKEREEAEEHVIIETSKTLFKTPQVLARKKDATTTTTKQKKTSSKTNDEHKEQTPFDIDVDTPSNVIEGSKAPTNTPDNIINTHATTDTASDLLTETALTAKLVLENSRRAEEKARSYKKQAREAFKSLANISEEMQRMKMRFISLDQEQRHGTPLTETKFLRS